MAAPLSYHGGRQSRTPTIGRCGVRTATPRKYALRLGCLSDGIDARQERSFGSQSHCVVVSSASSSTTTSCFANQDSHGRVFCELVRNAYQETATRDDASVVVQCTQHVTAQLERRVRCLLVFRSESWKCAFHVPFQVGHLERPSRPIQASQFSERHALTKRPRHSKNLIRWDPE